MRTHVCPDERESSGKKNGEEGGEEDAEKKKEEEEEEERAVRSEEFIRATEDFYHAREKEGEKRERCTVRELTIGEEEDGMKEWETEKKIFIVYKLSPACFYLA